MKKKIMSLIALSLVGTMMVTSLTGCGLQTKATDITVDDGDTIIVDQEDMETEETEPETDVADTEDTNSDDITGEEVVGDDTEANDFMGAEDENIVLYAEIAEYGPYGGLNDFTYNEVNNVLMTDVDLPIYNGDGVEVGYVKSGSSIPITEYGNCAWSRFKNPIDGTDYDYLYVMKKYVTEGNLITTTDAENIVKEELARRSFDVPTFTSVTDDMEIYEFRIPSAYENEYTGPNYQVDKYLNQRDSTKNENEEPIRFYKTYAVICTEDTDGYIICQIYYKDAITDEEWKTYRE